MTARKKVLFTLGSYCEGQIGYSAPNPIRRVEVSAETTFNDLIKEMGLEGKIYSVLLPPGFRQWKGESISTDCPISAIDHPNPSDWAYEIVINLHEIREREAIGKVEQYEKEHKPQ